MTMAQTRLSKAPAASSSPFSAARVSKAAIDSVSFVLCRSLKSHNFFIIVPCSARMRKAIRKSLACTYLPAFFVAGALCFIAAALVLTVRKPSAQGIGTATPARA
jgi:hypothetical protein